MAIDSSLFAADIPAGTYTAGDVVSLVNIAGPVNVRSGRGTALLKQIMCGRFSQNAPHWEIHVKNSDWIDEVVSVAGNISQATSLDDYSSLVQFGCDNNLQQNSGWQVYAVCILGGTSSAADSIFALIDVDYPSVSAITDPDRLAGFPTSIKYEKPAAPISAIGAMVTANWDTQSVDYFKAGFEYCIQSVEMFYSSSSVAGFIAFSNAAGMGGLQRIIPVNANINSIRYKLRYASKLVKGPMDVKTMFFAATATTGPVVMIHDYVKRRS